MHSTLKRGATIPPASSLPAQQRKLHRFRHLFNDERPHEALAMRRPAELDRPSSRSLPPRIPTFDCSSHFLVRRVSACRTIHVLHSQLFVSNTLNGDFVGLEEVDDGVYDLFFCFYQIDRYELRTNRIQDILSKVASSHRRVGLAGRVLPMS